MRTHRLRTFLFAGVLGLFAALGSFAIQPPPLEASECGGSGSTLCKENTSCAGFFFFTTCTTTYDYWDDI